MNPFLVCEKFISTDLCSEILDRYQNQRSLTSFRTYSSEQSSLLELALNEAPGWDQTINDIVSQLNQKIEEYLQDYKHVDLSCYYFSHAVVMHQKEFHNIPSHYDSEWVPEKEGDQPIRNFNCLIYLNEEFEGGELIFPLQKFVLKPKTGTLVIFPTSFMFPHLTTPSIGDDRFVMGLNYYFDKKYKSRQNVEKPYL